ncbi:ARMS [Mytilus edulis]|uniref:KIDINS220 n=1 Tax=Mytilus edulis TaxID=6550 RepID=A0A8S3PWH0_MYTED|nr:ARMS [Mytilus edulis]
MEVWNKKLITAASNGDIEALKLCLQNGADIDYQDNITDCTPAVKNTQLQVTSEQNRLYTSSREDTTASYFRTDCTPAVDGWTALMMAAEWGHLEICRLLIDRGCKIDITETGRGETALMFAACGGHLEICSLLIDTGCKIDITDNDGETALHYAAEKGYLQITRCLVEQGGASPLIKTHQEGVDWVYRFREGGLSLDIQIYEVLDGRYRYRRVLMGYTDMGRCGWGIQI